MRMIRPYRDEDGRLRAGADAAMAALGDFLETEVGENPAAFDDLWRGLDQVRRRLVTHWEFHGTLYRLRMRPDGVRIRNAQDARGPSADLPLSTFEAVLDEWRRAWLPPS